MINIGKILKRSWYILWNYRILWIFGVLLALTTGGGSSGNSGSNSRSSQGDGNGFPRGIPENAPQWMHDLGQWFTQNVVPMFTHPEQYISTFVTIGIVLFLIVVVCSVLTALVRYPTETAVMRMVDEFENSGSKVGFRQGWKLGWTRRAFRLWLIDLILSIPVLLFVLLLISAGLIVFASLSSTFQIVNGVGVVAAIGLAFLSIFLMIVVGVFLSLLRNFFARAAALDDLGVRASLKYGWAMFKRNWKSAGLMWLVMIGIGIAFGVLGIIAFFLLIPLYLVLLIPAGLVAALPALIAYGIATIFTGSPLTWIIALVVAIPLFFTILFFPMVVVDGLYKIYGSNVWTLTYREIKALENLSAPVLPVEVVPEVEK
jgi:hypothetical protein